MQLAQSVSQARGRLYARSANGNAYCMYWTYSIFNQIENWKQSLRIEHIFCLMLALLRTVCAMLAETAKPRYLRFDIKYSTSLYQVKYIRKTLSHLCTDGGYFAWYTADMQFHAVCILNMCLLIQSWKYF